MRVAGLPAAGGADAEAIKSCSAAGYSSDLVSLLLGDSYHPGGLGLTRRLLDTLELRPGARLLDVASGIGTSALLAAAEHDVDVDGVDLSETNVARAASRAEARGLGDRVRFSGGDAERLPLPDGGWDAVVCECALCTFPDKAAAVAEWARVLRPGGRVGITDVTADRSRLPAELTGLGSWVACLADARPAEEYQQLLHDAGLRTLTVEQHAVALERMIRQIGARLALLGMTARPRLEQLGLDLDRAEPVLDAALQAVGDGILGYVMVVAEKPA